jgi:hypothetical protein
VVKSETPGSSNLPGVPNLPEFPNPVECHDMAINTLLHVLNNSKAKKSHKLVLIEIANHTNSEGLAWPSYQTLANKTGLSRRRVIDLVADLSAVGEVEILPEGGPHGEQGYRIPTGEVRTPRMKSRGETISPDDLTPGEIFDTPLVKSFHPNLYIESVYFKNESNEEEAWLTPNEAVKLGLTPGSRMYRQATGEVLPDG